MENVLNNAYELMKKEILSDEIIDILESGDDVSKAAAILKIKKIDDEKLANLLIFHLTNQHGQIREICAYKIHELFPQAFEYFQEKIKLDKFVAALNDVNPNIVRYILSILKYINDKEYIYDCLMNKITSLYIDIINKPRRGKEQEHIFTKKCFKIYWALESLKVLISLKSDIINHDKDKLGNILEELCNFEEYTIREKVAQILVLIDSCEFAKIKDKIKNDKNFFVEYANRKGQNENSIG